MANTNPIITLNVNGLNTPIKIHLKKERSCHRPSKNKTYCMLSTRNALSIRVTFTLKINGERYTMLTMTKRKRD